MRRRPDLLLWGRNYTPKKIEWICNIHEKTMNLIWAMKKRPGYFPYIGDYTSYTPLHGE